MNDSFDWSRPRVYYFIVQTFFEGGQVFDRVDELNLLQAATLWGVLAAE